MNESTSPQSSDDVASDPQTDRRRFLAVTGVAGLIAAGLGWATWHKQQARALSPEAAQLLWSSTFDTPQGTPLVLDSLRGKPLLINFWATWCTPCVQEIPLLMDFYRQHAANGWQLLGLAIDQPTPVKRFIAEMNMTYPVALAGLNGTELMKALGNERGGLPFTMALAADGRILMKKLGQLHAPDLADLAKVS
jgi:thiol-disulfide isomerase/thioredoxin